MPNCLHYDFNSYLLLNELCEIKLLWHIESNFLSSLTSLLSTDDRGSTVPRAYCSRLASPIWLDSPVSYTLTFHPPARLTQDF